ncbi:MAG: dihydrodipicolinate synthase family protein [Candidatus Dormibacteraceae bacterium]
MSPLFTGVGVALITLFDQTGKLDAEATAAQAHRLVQLGLQAVLVAGTTGEVAMLSDPEHRELVAVIAQRVRGKATVIAGVGVGSAVEVGQRAAAARSSGADCLLVPPPLNFSLEAHYREIKRAADNLPLLAHHQPDKYPPGISLELLGSLPLAGCKDSTGDPKRLLDEVASNATPIYAGSSSLISLAASIGSAGALLGIANAYPELSMRAFAGDGEAQLRLHVVQQKVKQMASLQNIKDLANERFGTSVVTRI